MERESSDSTSQTINVGSTISNSATRSEFFNQQEDPGKVEAREKLESIGLFIPMDKLELYHGRDPNGDKEEWSVRSDFSNSGNNTGNWNINAINALNTGDFVTAREFAVERTLLNIYKKTKKFHESWEKEGIEDRRRIRSGEIPIGVHRIISSDPNAIIISSEYSKSEQERISQAIIPLLPKILEGSPVDFKYRDTVPLFLETVNEDFNLKNKEYISQEEIPQILEKLKLRIQQSNNPQAFIDEDFVKQVAGSINSRFLLRFSPVSLIHEFALSKSDTFKAAFSSETGNISRQLPINRDFIARFLKSNYIVGLKTRVDSATLDKNISNTILFDLTKVNTEEKIKQKEQTFEKVFGEFSQEMNKSLESSKSHPLVKLLSENYYASPEEIIEEAKKVTGFENHFDKDAGNWEKFTLGEHTETVLRMFDETYADVLPAKLLPIMRLIILTHDLGKPEAAQEGKKNEQKGFNLKEGSRFLNELGIENNLKELILGIIGQGQEITSDVFVKKNKKSNELRQYSRELLDKIKKVGSGSLEGEEMAIYFMSFMLQNSDSGAYTDYAVTRRRGGLWFRNYPSFNESLKTNSLDRRGAFLKE
ncbi:MAG TPA: hypothetical protein PK804_00880 [Candidatus Dojkabacteria bacterium]|nr:hypothetical protein [Candidatus Dojkabacteria bacterium]